MTNTLLVVGVAIVMAIFLGYIFGWLITRKQIEENYLAKLDALYRKRDEEKKYIESIELEVENYKSLNATLMQENERRENNPTDDEKKDELIKQFKVELDALKEKQVLMKEEFEKEIEAFLEERIDITERYKALVKEVEKHGGLKSKTKDKWFTKLFSKPSKS